VTRLLVINVARKPPSEPTVARNVLKWGTGALDIDKARLSVSPPSVPQPSFNSPTGLIYGFQAGEGRAGMMSDNSKGRWPTNLILEHKEGCHRECVPGCPVAEIDVMSGESESPSTPVTRGVSPLFGFGSEGLGVGYGDKGGASRFFKQFGGTDVESR